MSSVFSKIVQLRTPWTKMSNFFFSDFLKMNNFCQVTKEKDSYSEMVAAGSEIWNRKIVFIHSHNVIYCSVWKVLIFNKSSKWTPFCSIHNFALFLILFQFFSIILGGFLKPFQTEQYITLWQCIKMQFFLFHISAHAAVVTL